MFCYLAVPLPVHSSKEYLVEQKCIVNLVFTTILRPENGYAVKSISLYILSLMPNTIRVVKLIVMVNLVTKE